MNFQEDFADPISELLFPEFILVAGMFWSELGLDFQQESHGGIYGVQLPLPPTEPSHVSHHRIPSCFSKVSSESKGREGVLGVV